MKWKRFNTENFRLSLLIQCLLTTYYIPNSSRHWGHKGNLKRKLLVSQKHNKQMKCIDVWWWGAKRVRMKSEECITYLLLLNKLPKTKQLKIADVYYLTEFLRVKKPGVSYMGGSSSKSFMMLQPTSMVRDADISKPHWGWRIHSWAQLCDCWPVSVPHWPLASGWPTLNTSGGSFIRAFKSWLHISLM